MSSSRQQANALQSTPAAESQPASAAVAASPPSDAGKPASVPTPAPTPALPPAWPHDEDGLRTVCGRSWPGSVRRKEPADSPMQDCGLRGLTEADFDDLYALHRLVVERLPHPHVFRADRRDFMRRHIDERGWTVGAFLDGQLIGYAVVGFPRGEPDNLGRDLPLPPALVNRAAHFDGSAVHPDFRGSLLHRQMNHLRARLAVAAGYHQLFGTVSPLNPYSLRSHFAAGFMVKGLLVKYGGMDRLLIHRDGRLRTDGGMDDAPPPPPAPPGEVLVALDDVPPQSRLLAQGYWGWRVEATYGGRSMIAYAPAARLAELTGERQPESVLKGAAFSESEADT